MSRPTRDPRSTPAREPPEQPPPSFPEVMTDLWQRNYTGRVVLHFLAGAPKIVEFQGRKLRLK